MPQDTYFTTLKDRGCLTITETDKEDFLQGLISNDITLLKTQDCVYSCLLTPQGKFLYDFFITQSGDILKIECEGGQRVNDFAKVLNMYKLRSNVQIDIEESITVYAVFGSTEYGHKDPRHADMGYRSFEKPDLPEKEFDVWDRHRINLAIPNGSRDLIPQKSTLAEGRIDELHGLSYDKGCYVGQELTARMHYRGLAKKYLTTVTPDDLGLNALPAFGENHQKRRQNNR